MSENDQIVGGVEVQIETIQEDLQEEYRFSAKNVFKNRATCTSVLSLNEIQKSMRMTGKSQHLDESMLSGKFGENLELNDSHQFNHLAVNTSTKMQPGKDYPISGQTASTKATQNQEEEKKGDFLDDKQEVLAKLPKLPGMMTMAKRKSSIFDSQVVKRISKEDIRLLYTFEKVLGQGNFGTARLAHKIGKPEKKFAIKSLARKHVEADLALLQRELNILLSVDHPNIVKFYEAFLDHKYVHLVMEYCHGGELYARLLEEERFAEQDAKKIIKQCLQALKHLHDLNIAHRDLKPENVLFSSDQINVKLIDFGMSKLMPEEAQKMNTKLGTPYYVSPEVLNGNYDKRCDLWSIGVICYVLLAGEPPFHGENAAQVFKKIQTTDYEFSGEIWEWEVSQTAQRFIERLIQPNLKKRMTVEEALQHSWLVDADGPFEQVKYQQHPSTDVFLRLADFSNTKLLQVELLLVFVKQILDENDLKDNKEAFQIIDADHSGTITEEECLAKLKQMQAEGIEYSITEEDVTRFINKVDIDQTGEINYSQFLVGTLTPEHFSDTNMANLFHFLDNYSQGYLTKESLLKTFIRNARGITMEEVEHMMKELDLEVDAKIGLEDLRKLIHPNYKK